MEPNTLWLMALTVLVLVLLISVITMRGRIEALRRELERTGINGYANPPYTDQLSPLSTTNPEPTALSVDQQALEHRLIELIRAGNKIRAIKELREARKLSLKDAKDAVEALERK